MSPETGPALSSRYACGVAGREINMKKLLATALAVLPCAAAADAPAGAETTVVTATRSAQPAYRLPAAVYVIDRAAIAGSGAASLAGLLRGRAGIEVLDSYGDGSRATVGLRGFGENAGSNTLVLLDGAPLNNPDIGAPDLGSIALADIERIEILHGGNAHHGDQAVGGVINIISRRATQPGWTLGSHAGSFGERGLRLDGALPAGDLLLRLGARTEARDNYRDHNALERNQFRLGVGDTGAVVDWQLNASHSVESLLTPGALFPEEAAADRRQSAADFARDYSDLDKSQAHFALDARPASDWDFHTSFGLRRDRGDFRLSFRGFPSEPASQDRDVFSLRLQAGRRHQWRGRTLRLALGADSRWADYQLRSQFGLQANEQRSAAIWLAAQLPLADRWDAQLALRNTRISDRIRDAGDFASLPDGRELRQERTLGSAGLAWRPAPAYKLFLSWDQVLRYPKVDEYFGSGFTPDTIGLAPQTGDSVESGFSYQAPRWQASLLLWQLDLENEIAFDPATFTNVNIERSRRRGLTVDGALTLGGGFSLTAAASWQRARLQTGGQPERRMPLVADRNGRLGVDFRRGDWSGRLHWVASGTRLPSGDFDNSLPALPGHAVLDLGAGWQRGAWAVDLQIANLLDREYVEQGIETTDADFNETVGLFPLPTRRLRLAVTLALD